MGGFGMVDYPDAEEHFVPRDFMFNFNAQSAIVIHKTGGDGTPAAVLQTFLQSRNSVHYAIGQDGAIWQFVPEALGAGGNCCVEPGYDTFWQPYLHTYGNLNLCTLSVEHCDPRGDNSSELTPEQKAESFKLIAHLAKKYSIPVSHIKTHASIDPITRARCPGNYPMDELLQFLQTGGIGMGVPAGWHDDGTTLTAPNGHKVVLGFRERVLAGWDPHNVPLEEEHGQDPLEQYFRQADNKGTQQVFLYSVLCFNQTRGVYVMGIGNEFLGTRNKVKQLSDQIAQLQKTGGS
jgi:N-acetylmuramoyl-L-alanine amidase